MSEKIIGHIKIEIQKWQNPYPKDIFSWDSQEELDFKRGRFHKFLHDICENARQDMLKIIEEAEDE